LSEQNERLARVRRFADWLKGLNEERGTLARLRRSLMYGEDGLVLALGEIPPHHLRGLSMPDQERYVMVAALYAIHRNPLPAPAEGGWGRNLGWSLRRLAAGSNEEGAAANEVPESLKRRFNALLAADATELLGYLRPLIQLLASKDVSVDWGQLLYDLGGWSRPDRRVAWRWSRSFYNLEQSETGGDQDHAS
jgi:CRISPR type I-E-associated protein CasB/Cse2